VFTLALFPLNKIKLFVLFSFFGVVKMVRYFAVFTALFFSLDIYANVCAENLNNCKQPMIEIGVTCSIDSKAITGRGHTMFECASSVKEQWKLKILEDARIKGFSWRTEDLSPPFSLIDGVKTRSDASTYAYLSANWTLCYSAKSCYYQTGGEQLKYTGTYETGPFCDDDNYPDLIPDLNNLSENVCRIKICNDGYLGDPEFESSSVCARITPTIPYDKCGETGLNMKQKPSWPDCATNNLPELPDLPEPPPEPICKPYLSNGFSTTVCLVDSNDVCSSSGVCQPGCGSVTDSVSGKQNFVCFGDDPSDYQKPDFDLPEDSQFDPSVEGSCRKINGTSYCPQDETKHINPDGTYPDGCGYVDDEFYCISDSIFASPITPNEDFNPDTLTPVDASNTTSEKLLSGIQGDIRKASTDLSKNLDELGGAVSTGLGKVKNSVDDLTAREQSLADRQAERDAKRDGKLDDIKAGLESLGGETEVKNYNLPTTGSDPFAEVLGAETITAIEGKIESSKGDLQALMDEVKGVFSTGSLTVSDSGYVPNMVDIKGVNLDLGSHWLEKFSTEFGIQHILWFMIGVTGFLIVLGVKF